MKSIKIFLILVAIATMISLSSCNSCSSNNNSGVGAVVSGTETMDIDGLLSKAESLNGEIVRIEGVCIHICAHGARKIFLMGSDDAKTIRIESSTEIGQFKPECINSIVGVSGTLVEERWDEAYLQKWEEQVKAETEEQHGDGEGGCSTEQKARGEEAVNSTQERISNLRQRIIQRNEKEGKPYLSFYHVLAHSYEIK